MFFEDHFFHLFITPNEMKYSQSLKKARLKKTINLSVGQNIFDSAELWRKNSDLFQMSSEFLLTINTKRITNMIAILKNSKTDINTKRKRFFSLLGNSG